MHGIVQAPAESANSAYTRLDTSIRILNVKLQAGSFEKTQGIWEL